MDRQLFNELLQFCFTYAEDDDIWFVGERYPLIFQVCMDDWVVKDVIRIKDDEFKDTKQYWDLVKVQNKIVLLPSNHNKITIYHTDTHDFSCIYLESVSAVMGYYKEGEKLYLISDSEIIILDIEQEKINECIPIPYENIIISGRVFGIGGHIFILLIYNNQILDFCVEDKHFSCLDINCDVNGFVTGLIDDSDVWLAGCSGRIVKWNYISGKCSFYDELPDKFKSYNYKANGDFVPWTQGWTQGICLKYWYDCFMVGDKIWFIPFLSDSLLYIEKQSNIICQYLFGNEEETELTVKTHQTAKFLFMGVWRKRYIKIYSTKRNIIYSIDARTLECTEEIFNIKYVNEEEVKNIIYNVVLRKGTYENKNITTRQLIDIINSNKSVHVTNGTDGQIGTYIYQFLKN